MASALLIGAVVCSLSACSSSNGHPAPSASASSTSRAAATGGVADPSGKCTNGVSTPTQGGEKIELPGCDLVDVLGSGNTINLGDTEQLTAEGSNNTITVSNVRRVVNLGKDNTVYYTGDEPEFDERGSGTRVLPATAEDEHHDNTKTPHEH